jgi:hypothetical protein
LELWIQTEKEDAKMGDREYLEKYVRTLSSGALGWDWSIFSRSGQWDASELLDAAVDIAWEVFMYVPSLDLPGIDIHQSGNYLVIGLITVENGNFLANAGNT